MWKPGREETELSGTVLCPHATIMVWASQILVRQVPCLHSMGLSSSLKSTQFLAFLCAIPTSSPVEIPGWWQLLVSSCLTSDEHERQCTGGCLGSSMPAGENCPMLQRLSDCIAAADFHNWKVSIWPALATRGQAKNECFTASSKRSLSPGRGIATLLWGKTLSLPLLLMHDESAWEKI